MGECFLTVKGVAECYLEQAGLNIDEKGEVGK